MAIKYEDLKKANDCIKTTDIKGKEYAEVNQRIKAFRMVYPEGFIITECLKDSDGICLFSAKVGYDDHIIGMGHAYEKENSSFINKTSYIENCETSAVGRALGMAGFGIDTSVASYEEVATAIENQNAPTASPNQIKILEQYYTGDNLEKLLQINGIKTLDEMPMKKASDLIGKLNRGDR